MDVPLEDNVCDLVLGLQEDVADALLILNNLVLGLEDL